MPPAKTRAGRARQRSKPDAHSVSPTALAGHPGPNALRVLRLSELTPAPFNPRKISDKALAGLQESLKKFGLVQPIITNKRTGHVVGGHARITALMKNGAETAECLEVDLSEADELALNITLNNPNIAGEFTDDLQALLDQLHSSSPDMVSPLNLNDLWNGSAFAQGKTDPDEAPPLPKNPVTKLGDVWKLGRHRLVCGDSSAPETFRVLLGDSKIDLVFADPPYGIDYGAKNRFLNSFQPSGRNLKDIANDAISKDDLFALLTKAFTLSYDYGQDHCSYYVTAPQGGELGLMMMMMMMASNLPTRHVLIWNKDSQNFSMGRLDYEYKHEPILYTWKKTHRFNGGGDLKNSVWDIPKPRRNDVHPTMKPVDLVKNAVLNSSVKDDIVVDMFAGSGTTLIACEAAAREFRGIELDPAYCDVIVKRWEDFTGQKATRETT